MDEIISFIEENHKTSDTICREIIQEVSTSVGGAGEAGDQRLLLRDASSTGSHWLKE